MKKLKNKNKFILTQQELGPERDYDDPNQYEDEYGTWLQTWDCYKDKQLTYDEYGKGRYTTKDDLKMFALLLADNYPQEKIDEDKKSAMLEEKNYGLTGSVELHRRFWELVAELRISRDADKFLEDHDLLDDDFEAHYEFHEQKRLK